MAGVTEIRDLYLDVAQAAAELLAAPEVAAAWDEPSALAQLSVRGLAGHMAAQVFFIPSMLADPVPVEPVVGLDEYYARAAWIGTDLDTEFNQSIRAGGEKVAGEGPEQLAARTAACIADLRKTLSSEPDRPVRRPNWSGYSVSLDTFVASRMLELIVHSDDLAHSVGVPTPQFPAEAVQTVVDVLTRIALRRHGQTAVLRALSRSERAPASISAL
jgi:hypothetical protein